jgi:hypothetical protein
MGAGCLFRHKNTKTKAAWINIPYSNEEDNIEGFDYKDTEDEIKNILTQIGYTIDSCDKIRNGLFEIKLEGTYYGDGIIIYIEPRYSQYDYYSGKLDSRYTLAMANHHRAENKIWKALQKECFELNIATGGYTSQKIGKIE